MSGVIETQGSADIRISCTYMPINKITDIVTKQLQTARGGGYEIRLNFSVFYGRASTYDENSLRPQHSLHENFLIQPIYKNDRNEIPACLEFRIDHTKYKSAKLDFADFPDTDGAYIWKSEVYKRNFHLPDGEDITQTGLALHHIFVLEEESEVLHPEERNKIVKAVKIAFDRFAQSIETEKTNPPASTHLKGRCQKLKNFGKYAVLALSPAVAYLIRYIALKNLPTSLKTWKLVTNLALNSLFVILPLTCAYFFLGSIGQNRDP